MQSGIIVSIIMYCDLQLKLLYYIARFYLAVRIKLLLILPVATIPMIKHMCVMTFTILLLAKFNGQYYLQPNIYIVSTIDKF